MRGRGRGTHRVRGRGWGLGRVRCRGGGIVKLKGEGRDSEGGGGARIGREAEGKPRGAGHG